MAADSLQNVVGRVSDEAKEEMMTVLSEGIKEAEVIVESAKREAYEAVTKILESKERQADAIRRRIVGNAELLARNKVMQLSEEAVNKVFKEGLEQISHMPLGGIYEDALKAMLEEGAEALGVKEMVCSCNERDLKAVKKMASDLAKQKKVKIEVDTKHLSCAGGVRLGSADGSVVYDNTVEARLARNRPFLRRHIYNLLSKEG